MSSLMSEDLRVDVKIKGKVRHFNFAKDLEISHDNLGRLNVEMSQQPSQFAWIGVLHALAMDQVERIISKRKAMHAKLDKQYRLSREETGIKVTEALISSDIERDTDYKEVGIKVLDMKLQKDILYVALEAFRHRKDMMISVGTNLRQEFGGEISINKEKARLAVKKTRTKKENKSG